MYPQERPVERRAKFDLIQLRLDPDLKDDIMGWCRKKGLTLSCYTRMVYAKTLEDDRQMNDPRMLQPIENAVSGVNRYLPVMKKSHYSQY